MDRWQGTRAVRQVAGPWAGRVETRVAARAELVPVGVLAASRRAPGAEAPGAGVAAAPEALVETARVVTVHQAARIRAVVTVPEVRVRAPLLATAQAVPAIVRVRRVVTVRVVLVRVRVVVTVLAARAKAMARAAPATELLVVRERVRRVA